MKLTSFLACIIAIPMLHAEPLPAIRLWEGDAPGALGQQETDVPTLTPYLAPADKASGTAIVICPGGGYGGLAPHEGEGYANYLTAHGVSAFVLKYRLGSKGYRHPAMLNDVQRAIRTVRAGAEKWGFKIVGVMGSSAGGHLASTALTHFDAGNTGGDGQEKMSSRPDFGVLCYAVISMEDGVTHAGSKNNLLGKEPDAKLVEFLSSEKQVTKDTPPCFLWATWEDKAVPVENSLRFVSALQKAGVAYDFHVFQKGAHGIGLGNGRKGNTVEDAHPWGRNLIFWLRQNGWAK